MRKKMKCKDDELSDEDKNEMKEMIGEDNMNKMDKMCNDMKEMNDSMKEDEDFKDMKNEDGEWKKGMKKAKLDCAKEMVDMDEDMSPEQKEKFGEVREMMRDEDETEDEMTEDMK